MSFGWAPHKGTQPPLPHSADPHGAPAPMPSLFISPCLNLLQCLYTFPLLEASPRRHRKYPKIYPLKDPPCRGINPPVPLPLIGTTLWCPLASHGLGTKSPSVQLCLMPHFGLAAFSLLPGPTSSSFCCSFLCGEPPDKSLSQDSSLRLQQGASPRSSEERCWGAS